MYKINRLDDFGRGVTSIDNKTCFVFNALEDEEVDVLVTSEKSKYLSGESKSIKNLSADRKKAECPYYFECGGCNTMHMKYQKELDFKLNKVKSILKRFSNLDNVIKEILYGKEFNYRNKVSLKVKNGVLGYYQDKSNDVIKIDKCLLVKEKINEVIEKLNSLNLNSLKEVIIRVNYKDEVLIGLIGDNIGKEYFKSNLNSKNIVIVDNSKREIICGNDYIIDRIGDLLFKVSLESFFQVNYQEVLSLYNKVLDYASLKGNENILDLYCGTGTIGMFLSKKAKNVFGIEINEKAIEDANYNKELNNIKNIDFLCNDVSKVKNKFKDIDLVVIDPPRAGLDKNAIKNVLDINSKKIIYVSCDPVTLARDLNILKDKYEVKEVTLVNMFPNTYHIESIALLESK